MGGGFNSNPLVSIRGTVLFIPGSHEPPLGPSSHPFAPSETSSHELVPSGLSRSLTSPEDTTPPPPPSPGFLRLRWEQRRSGIGVPLLPSHYTTALP